MDGFLLRRIAAGLFIVSLFLPWVQFYVVSMSGFDLALNMIDYNEQIDMVGRIMGQSDLGFLAALSGILLLASLIMAGITLVKPLKGISLGLIALLAIILLPLFFSNEGGLLEAGFYLAIFSLILMVFALFVREGQVKPQSETAPLHQEGQVHGASNPSGTHHGEGRGSNQLTAAAMEAQPQPHRFCVYCGTKLLDQAKFCAACGKEV